MELETGTIVDRYAVEGLLGQGGMAVVYRVRHQQLGTLHALKVLMLPAQSIRDRLVQEGRVQAKLRHPNIVAVTDLVEVEGAPGLVMEFIAGPSLDDLLRHCDLAPDQADLIARGVLAGVAAAHGFGLVHRDLKPGNVLLEVTPDALIPKVTDFGLAKLVGDDGDGSGSKTRSGLAMGTPCYMAPEQIRNAKGVDARADVFSLGAVLYELVTGRRAFDGDDTFEIFTAVTAGKYTPVAELAPGVPERMVRAIDAALTTDRDARVGSVAELLALWTDGQPAPDAAVAFAPALIGRARELGSGADDKPLSWAPSKSSKTSSGGGKTAGSAARASRGEATMDLSSPGVGDDPPPAPSLASVERPRPQPQTSENRDPTMRRLMVGASVLLTIGFVGLLTVGLVGGGALVLTSSSSAPRPAADLDGGAGARRAEAGQLAKVEAKSRNEDALSEEETGAAEPARPAEGALAAGPAPGPSPAASPAPAPTTGAPAAPAPDVVAEGAEAEDAIADADAGAEEPAAGGATEPALEPPPVATGQVDLKVAMHPMAAGASAVGEAWLVGGGQRYPLPGAVPAGSYTIEASFNKKPVVQAGKLTVTAGSRITVNCFATIKECRI